MSACSYYRQSRAEEEGGREVVFQHKSPNEMEKKNPYCRQGSLSV